MESLIYYIIVFTSVHTPAPTPWYEYKKYDDLTDCMEYALELTEKFEKRVPMNQVVFTCCSPSEKMC